MIGIFRTISRIASYFVPFLVGLLAVLFWFKQDFIDPADPEKRDIVAFEVPKGATMRIIAEGLEGAGLISKWYSVYYLSRFKARNNEQVKILAGEYELSPSMKPLEVLNILLSGKLLKRNVTIPEGTTLKELPEIFAKALSISSEEIKAALTDSQFLGELGISSHSLEGFIFPETYSFSRPITAEDVIRRIVSEGYLKIEEKIPNWKEKALELSLSPVQVITLASIIEKETASPEERARIASVFHNRLKIAMPLQSDPTVIYGIKDFNGNLTKADLKNPSPYNTYVNAGLPPTPICNPGIDSIRAALFPENTEFLFFVGRGDGTHQFSATYKEHALAVERYQKNNQANNS